MPVMCRFFKDLLVVKISDQLTEYRVINCIMCHMTLSGVKR